MYDHRRRLEWARKHLDVLDKSIRVFLQSTPCHLTLKFNPKTRAYEGRVTQLKLPDPAWSMMVGDIIHALRSALDNLVYALVVAEQGAPPTDYKILRKIQFPICRKDTDFKSEAYRIELVSELAKTGIERLQPCNGRIPGEHHPLAVLNDLANIDKHRHIILTYHWGSEVVIKVSGPGIPEGTRFGGYEGPIEENTLIGGFFINAFPGGPPIEYPLSVMDVHPNLALDIKFRAGGYEGSVIPFLRALCDRIDNEIFVELERLLPPCETP